MEAAQYRRLLCWIIGLASPLGLYSLIRVLPSLLTAGTGGVVFRELTLIATSIAWLVYLAWRGQLPAGALGLARPKPGDIGWGVAAAFVILTVSVAISVALRHLGIETHSETALGSLAARPPWLLLLIVLASAISEEAVFRAALIPAVEQASGSTTVAILLSAAIFALLHLGTYGAAKVLVVFLPGLVIAGLFAWRRSLTSCLIAHALIDGFGLAPLIFGSHA